jgi:hypothetical protein
MASMELATASHVRLSDDILATPPTPPEPRYVMPIICMARGSSKHTRGCTKSAAKRQPSGSAPTDANVYDEA